MSVDSAFSLAVIIGGTIGYVWGIFIERQAGKRRKR